MGTFGTGNFDNDAALDFVHEIAAKIREEFHAPTEFEDLGMLMGAVEVYRVLVERCCATPPERAELESLRDATLAVFDQEKDAFTTEATVDHIANRREVISNTFVEFLRLCEEDPEE